MVLMVRCGTVVLILAMGVLISTVLVRTVPEVRTSDPEALRTRMEVISVQRVAVQRQWQAYGTARAVDRADVPARVTSEVIHVPDHAREGQWVERGQLLIQLDESDFVQQAQAAEKTLTSLQAELAQLDVEAQRFGEQLQTQGEVYDLVEAEYERLVRLFERDAANQRDVDGARRAMLEIQAAIVQLQQAVDLIEPRRRQLEASIAAQQANLEMARLNLRRCQVVSPITGILQAVDVRQGETVAPGQRVARVVSLDRIEVPLSLPASARFHVQRGDMVLLRSTSRVDCLWEAEITRLAPEDDPQTRTFTVYAEIEQPEASQVFGRAVGRELLLPGAFVDGSVIHQAQEMRWVVPRRAIRGGRLFLVQDQTIHSRPVTAAFVLEAEIPAFNLPDDQWAVLAEGSVPVLETGELVVVNVTPALSDGVPVTPVVLNAASQTAARDGQTDQEALP